jgi:regulator of protease activity HflC (stomatin/prohibitin superfamily)
MFGFKIIRQYEQGLVFRWGKLLPSVRGAGLTWVNPVSDRVRKVNMQVMAAAVPSQQAITRDNVTVKVGAVVYYRVIDPAKAIVNVKDYTYAIAQVAQTSLRSVIGHSDLDQLLSEREKINTKLRDIIDAPVEQSWGIRVERVEVKDITLPDSMQRSMSRQAEAERERRARIIAADGEYQASAKLAQAADAMAADPAALQLRLLQAIVEIASERSRTVIVPVPVELLRYFERAARGTSQAQRPAAYPVRQPSLPAPSAPTLALPADLRASAPSTATRNTNPEDAAHQLTTGPPVHR